MSLRSFGLAVTLCLALTARAYAQGSYHVVIGAFESEDNAKRMCQSAYDVNVWATYSFNEEKKMYYVYVRNTRSLADANRTAKDMRAEGFSDAWVYKGSLGDASFVPGNELAQPDERVIVSPEVKPTAREQVEPETTIEAEAQPSQADQDAKAPEEPAISENVRPAGKPFIFRLTNEATGNPVTGMVRLQEAERSPQFRPYQANETVYIVPPNNRSGKWYVTCQVIGFRSFKKPIDYNDPQRDRDVQLGSDQEIIFPVTLTRVKRGDYVEMDEVKFLPNSSILTPDSKRELMELLAMMNENPNYRIRLHGHTNGDDGRDIIALGRSRDFFALNTANERRAGSAKELSELRAETIKQYLLANGISDDRIAVKGEAGKQPIFDPRGTNAGGNDRVEVEITRH